MAPDWWKACVSELVGTFMFTFVAAGAICTNQYSGGELGLLGVALAAAFAYAVAISATGHVSGGHLNPAVTLAALLSGAVRPLVACLYLVAQLAGAALAGVLLHRTFSVEIWQPVALGTPTLSAGVSFGTAIYVEALLTFFLTFTVLQVTVHERAPRSGYGFVIGTVLLFGILVGGPITGAALNPARAFGPALLSGVWTDHLVYWIGPFVGAVLGAVAHSALRSSED